VIAPKRGSGVSDQKAISGCSNAFAASMRTRLRLSSIASTQRMS